MPFIFLISFFISGLSYADAATDERVRKEEEKMAKIVDKYDSPLDFGIDISYSPRKYTNYQYTSAVTSEMVGYAGSVNVEWLPLQQFGKLGLGVGSGFSVHPNVVVIAGGGTSGEDLVATLYTVPVEFHLSYHADYFKNQIIVPYGKIGPSITFIKQNSEFGYSRDGILSFKGLDFAAGLQLNLNPLEKSAARDMDLATGINTSYLFAEYHVTNSMGTNEYDLSRKEWRLGLRFEF